MTTIPTDRLYFSPPFQGRRWRWLTRVSAFFHATVSQMPLRGNPIPSPSSRGEGLIVEGGAR